MSTIVSNCHTLRLRRLPARVVELVGAASAASSNYTPHHVLQQRRNLSSIDQLDRQKNGRERVIVLGSGWAGFTVARRLDPKKFQTIIISPRSYFVFTPLLASTSVGTLEFRTALEPIRNRRMKADFLQGWAEKLDLAEKRITVEEAADDPHQSLAPVEPMGKPAARSQQPKKFFDLAYDKLVISVGCYSQTFGTKGVREHSYFLKDVGDARRIRQRLLDIFEIAALPTTSDEMKKYLLNFAIVGGGPTGIEFSAELHDLVTEDMAKLYPDLMKYFHVTVYDVAPKVLPMFDKKLGQYVMDHLSREGIDIKTSHHVQELRPGPPSSSTLKSSDDVVDQACYTLKTAEDGEIGIGMCVWSTGLMMNPFVQKHSECSHKLPSGGTKLDGIDFSNANSLNWHLKHHPKTGALLTDDRLRLVLELEQPKTNEIGMEDKLPRATIQDVYALGDCATIENTEFPATAQVASQKAEWLVKRLNKGDIDNHSFKFHNLGVMAYLGNWKAAFQPGRGGQISGWAAFVIWRGAYLTKAVSIRNKILIPTYWFLNWLFGRDVSRF